MTKRMHYYSEPMPTGGPPGRPPSRACYQAWLRLGPGHYKITRSLVNKRTRVLWKFHLLSAGPMRVDIVLPKGT